MSRIRQSILASPPAALLLALAMAILTAPVLMLSHVNAVAATTPPPCTVANANGCTELSPIPPEDTAAVPPNIVLMLDDSGSMDYDYMPDWDYLANTTLYGVRNAAINGIYYNPTVVYTPPPKADGNLYPDSPGLTDAYRDGFLDASAQDITNYTATAAADNNKQFRFWENLATTQVTTTDHDYGPAVWGGGSDGSPGGCPSGYTLDPSDSSQCIRPSVPPTTIAGKWVCNSGDGSPYNGPGGVKMCHHYVWVEGSRVDYPYPATWVPPTTQCPSGSSLESDGLCHYPPKPVIPPTPPTPNYWTCPSGGTTNTSAPPPPSTPPECTSKSNTRKYVHAFTYVVGTPVNTNEHFVIPRTPDAPADGWCSVLYYAWQKNNCVNEDDTSGTAAPKTNPDGTPALAEDGTALTAGQNVANWFSYYRTRLLMAKSGLMVAFSGLDSKYRFGFGSINANGVANIPSTPAPYTFDDAMTGGGGGSASNRLAVVQPFGDGSAGTQRANFWTWLAGETAASQTPLRKALNAVGQYYQTAQPWSSMTGDPGWTADSDTTYACRASYTILTTDGFWNGDDPSGIGYAAGVNGPAQTVPSGDVTQYIATPPFSGGGVGSGAPSLADVATYYWENDLQPGMPNEVSTSTADPAAWQHMTTFTVGLGFTPTGILPVGTTVPQIFAWAHGGAAIPGFTDTNGWPAPSSNSINNIADLAHAAVNGHGNFFNVTDPSQLAAAFTKALADIAARTIPPSTAAVNASVLSLGALSFSTGYSTGDWSGALQAVTLNADGSVGDVLWKAGVNLNGDFHSATTYSSRTVFTDAYDPTKSTPFSVFQFTAANQASLDSTETGGLADPAYSGDPNDTLANRINYLLGDPTYEDTLYRSRTSILGAIIRSQPVYVSAASASYYGTWPTLGGVAPPENAVGAQTYDTFASAEATRPGMVYVGANDGMLHVFQAPVPQCSSTPDASGNCPSGDYTFASGTNPGHEAWAFIPRAVYANLGNLTNASDFHFLPTVDATPVTRDVFFSEGTRTPNNAWHTILAGGVGLGGRGVYALDITDPTAFSASTVLWEFDSDMTAASLAPAGGCFASYGSCRPSDLGYTLSQPNIGRLANGKWVVLVPNGYFPDCTTPDIPTGTIPACQAIAAQAPKDSTGKPYSALFVMDAETGKMIAELKTPTGLSGVTSFGLATAVLGDYNGDQVDDVAFAGDAMGNVWRFDLSNPNPSNWTVTLVYQGGTAYDPSTGTSDVVQPITSMPRLFPDPTTNRFMVVFGTGRFLGLGDNSDNSVQSVYGVRDVAGTTYTQADLTQQYLHEELAPATLADGVTPNPLAGTSLRCVTGSASDTCDSPTAVNVVSSAGGGWYVNLSTTTSDGVRNDAGERVVATPAAIFSSNTAVFGTLITGSQTTDACSPSTQGSVLALNVLSGGSAGMSSLGGGAFAGGRIANAQTSGNMAVVSGMGGIHWYLPGGQLTNTGSGPGGGGGTPQGDSPAWRRRSWQPINQNQ